MAFSPTKNTIKQQRSFKRRFQLKSNEIFLAFGDSAIIVNKECLFEPKYLRNFKKKIKLFKKKISGYRFKPKRKIWISLFFNLPLTKKSKNSRMGKGKGNFMRWAIKIKLGTKILEMKNFSKYRLLYFLGLLRKITKLKVTLLTKSNTYSMLSSKKTFYWAL